MAQNRFVLETLRANLGSLSSFLVSFTAFAMCFDNEINTQELKFSQLSKKILQNHSFVKQNFNSLVNVETLCSSKFDQLDKNSCLFKSTLRKAVQLVGVFVANVTRLHAPLSL